MSNFGHTDHHSLDLENGIDPEKNFFTNIRIDCQYYSEDQFNSKINTNNKISMIHFNSRSLYANFNSIKHYLMNLSQVFNIIAITETWIKHARGTDFELDGYEMVYINREARIGGGVALFVDKKY